MPNYADLDELKEAVVATSNVLTVKMEELRNAYGALRAGVNVRKDIAKKLAGSGLGHFPNELPAYQHEPVRLFTLGSPIHDLINSVLDPNEGSDEVLRSAVQGEAADVLAQVRALVCPS